MLVVEMSSGLMTLEGVLAEFPPELNLETRQKEGRDSHVAEEWQTNSTQITEIGNLEMQCPFCHIQGPPKVDEIDIIIKPSTYNDFMLQNRSHPLSHSIIIKGSED